MRRFHYHVDQSRLVKPILAAIDCQFSATDSQIDLHHNNCPTFITFTLYDNYKGQVASALLSDFMDYKHDRKKKGMLLDVDQMSIDLVQYPGIDEFLYEKYVGKKNLPGPYDIGNQNTITLILDMAHILNAEANYYNYNGT